MNFGFLINLEFLQNWASIFISWLNPAVIHNLEKYYALKKVHYLSTIEDIQGDYLEFGVFTGSSFCHSIRCFKRLIKLNPNISSTKLYGFDSFAGFGVLKQEDKHPLYKDDYFQANLSKVKKKVKWAAGAVKFQLVPGFFSESLKNGPQKMKIEKARIIFIDSDTFISASQALSFCQSIIQVGTYIVLDDYFSYRGREDRGVRRAFAEFIANRKCKVRQVFTYGMGGVVYIVSEC